MAFKTLAKRHADKLPKAVTLDFSFVEIIVAKTQSRRTECAGKFQGSKCQGRIQGSRTRELFANAEEAVEASPATVEPIQAQVPLRTVPAEVSHVAVAIDPGHGAECHDRVLPLLFGQGCAVREEFLDLGGAESVLLHLFDRVLRRDVAIEVEEFGFETHFAGAGQREALRRDVVVLPVVVAGGDHLLERHAVIDEELHLDGGEPKSFAQSFAIDGGRIGFDQVGEGAIGEQRLETLMVFAFCFEQGGEARQLA